MPYELDREIQSEVFYLTGGSKTIRVCPSNKVDLAGLKSKSSTDDWSPWGKLFMYFTYLYTTTTEMVYEGDELSVFGMLSYNVKSDEFTLDDPLGFIQEGQRE